MLNIPFICILHEPPFVSNNSEAILDHSVKHFIEDMKKADKKHELMKNAKSFSGGKFISSTFIIKKDVPNK